MNDLIGILIVCLLLAVLMGALALFKRIWQLSGELTRKLAHITMGLASLSFPWLFSSPLPVILLCVLSLILMLWMRNQRNPIRAVLHAVERQSYGELCFPVSVTLLFTIQADPVTDYLIPILVLTLADAVGALIGVRYGTSKYSTDEGHKSVEGSFAFFITAFLSTHILLLLGTDTLRLESLLIALVIGIIIMLVEAISWRGLDNLFIPLGMYLLLNVYTQMDAASLILRTGGLLLALVFFYFIRKRSYARDGTLLAGALALYLVWAVAGWLWALTPLLMTIGYSIMCPPSEKSWQTRHSLNDLGAVAGPGLLWLFLATSTQTNTLVLPFTISWAAQTGMIFAAMMTYKQPRLHEWSVALSGGICGLLCALPALLLSHFMPALTLALLFGFISATLSSWLLWRYEWLKRGGTLTPNRAWRQFAYSMGASSLCLIPLIFS